MDEGSTTSLVKSEDPLDDILHRITQEPVPDIAIPAVICEILASRPLTIDELYYFVVVWGGEECTDSSPMPSKAFLWDCCQGRKAAGNVEKANTITNHHDLPDQCNRHGSQIFGHSIAEWHNQIARTCLTILKLSSTNEPATPILKSAADTLRPYAITQWGYHVRRSNDADVLKLAMEYLFEILPGNREQLGFLLADMCKTKDCDRMLSKFEAAHIASYFGLPKEVFDGLNSSTLNACDELGQTPLSWAADEGHEDVVHLLLDRGVEVDTIDNVGRTPLSYAAQRGHIPVLKLLLATGEVEINRKDGRERTALSWAAEEGHEEVLGILHEANKVETSWADDSGMTLLHYAADNGNEDFIQASFKTGKLHVNSRD